MVAILLGSAPQSV